MTTQQIIKLCSAVATGLDSILAYADRVSALPAVSPTLAHLWPFIFLGIVAVDRGLHAYLDTPMPPVPATATALQGYGPVNPAPVANLPTAPASLGQPGKPV